DIAYQFPEIRQWFGQSPLEPYRFDASLGALNRGILSECLIRRNMILEGLALTALLVGTYAYGNYRLRRSSVGQAPAPALQQSNIDQRLRENIDKRTEREIRAQFNDLIELSLQNPRPDILIWPETSYPVPWCEVARDLPPEKVPTAWLDHEVGIRWELRLRAGQ